jgi:hypothetical protein
MGRCPSPTLLWSVPHFSCCYKPSPLQAHGGGGCGATPTFSCWLVYLQFMWRSAPPWLSGGMCYTLATVTSLFLSKHIGRGAATPAFSGWLVFLQFKWGVPFPHSLELRAPCPLCYVSFNFIFYSATYLLFSLFFSLFSLGGFSLSRGLCLFTMCCLAHLVVCFSQDARAGIWWLRSPPGFSI